METIQVNSIVRHKTHKNDLCGVVRAIHSNHKGKKGPFAIMQWTFYYFGCEEDPNYPETKFIAIPVCDLEITDPINVNDVDLKVLEDIK
tara:strand:- start:13 stop:279 length:267 start_codon:yes stop_codon:yes gene_type:complete